jgi:hypothetical protein
MTDTTMIATQAVEAGYQFDQRLQRAYDQAKAAADAAAIEERAAFEEVDRARGDLALNLIERGRLLKASRRLAKAQEASATAASALRATERENTRLRDERRRIENEIERRRAAELAVIREQSRARRREAWAEIWALLEEINDLPGLPSMRETAYYNQAIGHLSRLRNTFI